MADQEIEVEPVQCFHDDDYGEVNAHIKKTVRVDVAERWIAEGKALPAEKKS